MTAILTMLNNNSIYFIGDTAISNLDDNNNIKRVDGVYHKVGVGKGFIYAVGGDVPWAENIKVFLNNCDINTRIEDITNYCRIADTSTDENRNVLILGIYEDNIMKIIELNKTHQYKPLMGIGDESAQFEVIGYNQQIMLQAMMDISYKQKYTGDGETFRICEIAKETFKTGNCECIGGDYLDVAYLKLDGKPRTGIIPMEGDYADKFK